MGDVIIHPRVFEELPPKEIARKVFHELGHSKSAMKMSRPDYNRGMYSNKFGFKNKTPGKESDVRRLLEEAHATKLGGQALKEAGVDPKLIEYYKEKARNDLLTYKHRIRQDVKVGKNKIETELDPREVDKIFNSASRMALSGFSRRLRK